jgi:threonine aldolase
LDYVDNVIPVYTNIVIFNLNKKIQPPTFIEKLAANGIKATGFGKQAIRFVTHLDFTEDMLGKTEEILKKL